MVSEVIRIERQRRHWSQARLAAELGWHKSKIARLETGRRQVQADELSLFARVFDMTSADLVRCSEEMQQTVAN